LFSPAAVDVVITELETMIGQGGKMVSLQVYIGVGISGELHHMAGIVGAKIMIALNNDAKAPIFEQLDYSVVEYCRVLVPALSKTLKKSEAHAGRVTYVN
jgi:electron transfer flavoprotein alpha subunit